MQKPFLIAGAGVTETDKTIVDFNVLCPDPFDELPSFAFITEKAFVVFHVENVGKITGFNVGKQPLEGFTLDGRPADASINVDVIFFNPHPFRLRLLTTHRDLCLDG